MIRQGLLPEDRAAELAFLSFLPEWRAAAAEHVNARLTRDLDLGTVQVCGDDAARWYRRELGWDSAYFGVPMIRLECATWDVDLADPIDALARVALQLRDDAAARYRDYYVFAELPASDLESIQALGRSGFRLVETRLTYFAPDASAVDWPDHYPVRLADPGDVPNLRAVAAGAGNPYDRYHADPFFASAVAGRYLATYVEESVKGLADLVVVPDPGDDAPAGGFFTVKATCPPQCPFGEPHACPIHISVGRIPLVAVSSARSGWHIRLLVEVTRMLASRSVQVVCMTTQAANRAVVRNCEKVGFRLGRVTHVLAASQGQAR